MPVAVPTRGHSPVSPLREESLEIRAFASLMGLLLLGLVDNQILSPILPEIALSFGVTVGLIGVTVSGYALAAAMAALVVGPLSDRTGRRRPFLLGAGSGFALASLSVYVSPSFAVFAVARGLAGAAAGIISALVVTSIADVVPYDRRGRAMGWVASAYFAAPILGVPVASWVAEQLGWRALYIAFAVAAALLVLALRTLGTEAAGWQGQAEGQERPRPSYLRFLQHRSTAAAVLSAFFVSGGVTGFIIYLGAYLRQQFGLSVTSVGLVFLLSGSASMLGALGAGSVSDRVGKRTVALAGTLALAGFVLVFPSLSGGVLPYVCLAAIGLAAASRVAPLQSLVT
ncbi:MAG: MFS transporter, partial [Acidobacteriota bacterium]